VRVAVGDYAALERHGSASLLTVEQNASRSAMGLRGGCAPRATEDPVEPLRLRGRAGPDSRGSPRDPSARLGLDRQAGRLLRRRGARRDRRGSAPCAELRPLPQAQGSALAVRGRGRARPPDRPPRSGHRGDPPRRDRSGPSHEGVVREDACRRSRRWPLRGADRGPRDRGEHRQLSPRVGSSARTPARAGSNPCPSRSPASRRSIGRRAWSGRRATCR
jgi:hypothetical protein